jgi:hypothetical protein
MMFPTKEQFTQWDSEFFDEDENFDFMMLKAFQAGADRRLEQVIEWLKEYPMRAGRARMIADFKEAMRPQENNQ